MDQKLKNMYFNILRPPNDRFLVYVFHFEKSHVWKYLIVRNRMLKYILTSKLIQNLLKFQLLLN